MAEDSVTLAELKADIATLRNEVRQLQQQITSVEIKATSKTASTTDVEVARLHGVLGHYLDRVGHKTSLRVIDDALEAMELQGMHDDPAYQALKMMFQFLAPMADQPVPSADSMAMLIRQLVVAIRRLEPDNKAADQAAGYLARHGLEGSLLRESPDT